MEKIIYLLFTALVSIPILGFIQSDNTLSGTDDPVIGINIGNKAPELVFNNPEGKPIALSSLKGKIVLLDFWASWCGPCRHDNPNIVKAYNNFKDAKFQNAKGFTIYSVSLDMAKARWTGAIAKDKLNWEYHVSDLKGWGAKPAKIYGVRSIPTSFLLDANGVIIAKNLRGEALQAKLTTLLKQQKKKTPKNDKDKDELEPYLTK